MWWHTSVILATEKAETKDSGWRSAWVKVSDTLC
jgi:hypothetical protein